MSRARILKPGKGTLAALRHTCPHCGAGLGIRCTTPSGNPRDHVHSKRMGVARSIAMADHAAAIAQFKAGCLADPAANKGGSNG